MFFTKVRVIHSLLTILVLATGIIGDYVVFQSKYSESRVFRAITDSLTHGTIGLISSALFFSYNLNISNDSCVYGIILCTFLSTVIDVDHAIVARSLHLKDMLNLKHRGIFHCTTFCLLITLAILVYGYITKKIKIYTLAFIVTIAYTSHHLRDANRRGLWISPFGSTPPLTKFLYLAHIGLLPHLFAYIFINFRRYFVKNDLNHTMIV